MFILAIFLLCVPLVLGSGWGVEERRTPYAFTLLSYVLRGKLRDRSCCCSQVCLFSSFYLALGYVVTSRESAPFPCEEGYHPYQPLLPRLLHNSLPPPPGAVLDWRT